MTDIAWTTEQRKLSNLAPWDKNPRKLSDHDADQLRQSIERFGLADPLIVNTDGQLIGGHQRKKILVMMDVYGPDAEVDVRVPSRTLAGTELAELNIRLNRNTGEWNWDVLTAEFESDSLKDWGFKAWELGLDSDFDADAEWQGMPEFEQEDAFGALITLKVHFATAGDVKTFAELVNQTITEKTKYIWYPKQERLNLKEYIAHES